MGNKTNLKPGDSCQYNHAFLKNTGIQLEADICDMKGKIVSVVTYGGKQFVKVQWINEPEIKTVNPSNLCKIGSDYTE